MAGVSGAGWLVTRGQAVQKEVWPAATEEGQS